jgi:hypothetical protein
LLGFGLVFFFCFVVFVFLSLYDLAS